MSGEQNWEWNQNDALKAAGTITDLRREIIRLTAALEIANGQRDRWYAAAGQRQDELNEAHQALAWVCKNLPFEDGEKLPVELRPPYVVSRQVGIAKNAWSGWLEDNK